MILTAREQEIIRLLNSQPAGVTRDELTKRMNLSRRTIYRELKQLGADIAAFHLTLVKDGAGAYTIEGDAAALAGLRQQLTPNQTPTFDQAQRQNAILLRLLATRVPQTMQSLADAMQVGLTTIKQDLELVTPALTASNLTLNRQKATGVWVSGAEEDIRRVLTGIFAGALNPYLFFKALREPDAVISDPAMRYFYDLLPQAELQAAAKVAKATPSLDTFSDNQKKTLWLTVTVHAMRVEAGYHVKPPAAFNRERLFQDQQLALQFFAAMPQPVRSQVQVGDYQFLAMQLNAIRGGLMGERVDSFDLTVNLQVQALIKAVEAAMAYPFGNSESLYTNLVAHIQRATTGAALPLQDNPVLAHLQVDYPKLYAAVRQAADTVFGERAFTGTELAYLVLYFAANLGGPNQVSAAVLLVTPEGTGTGNLIAGKLKAALPTIQAVTAVSINDLPSVDFNRYALVLSTVALPGFAHQYLVVSPLVTPSELAAVKKALQTLPTPVAPPTSTLAQSVTTFEQYQTTVSSATDLLAGLNVATVANTGADVEAALNSILAGLPAVVTDGEAVAAALMTRLQLAPVGIPATGLALMHTANAGVTKPFIGAFDLTTTPTITAMDMQPIQLHRVLLMLTPPDPAPVTLQLLSAVSAKMVQSEAQLAAFETGNYTQIYQLLADAMLTEIKKIK